MIIEDNSGVEIPFAQIEQELDFARNRLMKKAAKSGDAKAYLIGNFDFCSSVFNANGGSYRLFMSVFGLDLVEHTYDVKEALRAGEYVLENVTPLRARRVAGSDKS